MDINITQGQNILYQDILTYEKFYLIKENSAYKIIIGKLKNEILIKYKNYQIKVNNDDLSILFEPEIFTIDEAYQYIINIFEYNQAFIKDIIINKSIILLLKANIKNSKKDIEITLSYNLINHYLKENNEIKKLKDEIEKLKDEIEILKEEIKIKDIDKKKMILSPNNLEYFYDIVKDSYSDLYLANIFSVFKSINKIFYLVYSNNNKSLILFDIISKKRIQEKKNAHNQYITNIRYFFDTINKRDLILSISASDNNIKLWNISDNIINSILNINNVYENGYLYSACLFNDNNNNYIITSSNNCEYIKIFDLNKNLIKTINDSNDKTFFIDIYYDKKLSKNYILTGNYDFIKSYDYQKNNIYKIYSDDNNNGSCCIIVNESKEIIRIIQSSNDGNLRIWDFHSGELLKKIKVSNENLREICMWGNEFIFIGCNDKTIKIIDLEKEIIIKELEGHNNEVISIKTIILPRYGKCLISQGVENDIIKLWKNKNINYFEEQK